MSLVNQMLRDLEKRRAGERHGAGSVFQGLVTTESRTGGSPLFIVFGLVVVLLGGAVGYLMWERRAQATVAAPQSQRMNEVAALHSAVVAPPVAPPEAAPAASATLPMAPAFVPLEPAPAREVRTVVVAQEEPRAREPATAPVAPARVTSKAAVVTPAAQPAPVAIEKRVLPPSPQQLAAAAYQKGYEALGAGQRDEAERHLREALRHDPEHLPGRESLAGILLAAGRRVEAGEVLDDGLKLRPQVAVFRKLKARLLVDQNDLQGAVAILEAGLEGASRDGEYQALLGALYQRQNAFGKSADRYQQALMLDPRQGVWWLGLAISAERSGQQEGALTAYRRALDNGVGEKLAAYAKERIAQLEAGTKKQ